jgi:hypothetical protein
MRAADSARSGRAPVYGTSAGGRPGPDRPGAGPAPTPRPACRPPARPRSYAGGCRAPAPSAARTPGTAPDRPASGPHPDELALVHHILNDERCKSRKHHVHKLVDIFHAPSTTTATHRHHRLRDRADRLTDPMAETTPPSLSRVPRRGQALRPERPSSTLPKRLSVVRSLLSRQTKRLVRANCKQNRD